MSPHRPRRHLDRWAGWSAAAMMALAGVAFAQEAQPVDEVPANVRQADDLPAIRETLGRFFGTQLPRLLGDDTDAAQRARERIIRAIEGDVSATYQDAYARELAEAVAGLYADPGTPLSARLSAAVAVRQAARQTRSARLVPTVEAVIADDDPAVAIWGIKAARPLVASSMQINVAGQEPLVAGIVAAAERHAAEGFVADEAFNVLSDVGGAAFEIDQALVVANRGKPQIVAATLGMLERRLAEYGPPAEGDLAPRAPPLPIAEQAGTLLLANQVVWSSLDDPTKARARSALARLAAASGEAAAVAQDAQAGVEDPEQRERLVRLRDELRATLIASARALAAIAGFGGASQVIDAAGDVEDLPRGIGADAIRQRTQALVDAVAASFPDVDLGDAAD